MMPSVLVSCGSNVDSERNLEAAVELLARVCEIGSVSRVFATRGVGATPMPEFRNAALELKTDLSPGRLKYSVLRDVEARLGRRRTRDASAPRTIDLDISLFGDQAFESEPLGLWIPDPEIETHLHVAVPLADIAPERRHPVSGDSLGEIARRLLTGAQPGDIRALAEL